jgi:thiamine biosynthesis protein ThiI
MIKIADALAKIENAKGIVTGDSLGQVASQTLENLQCIHAVARMPIFSPLIGLNKNEIIDLAKKIGTYTISIEPYDECCTFMTAKHPVIKADHKFLQQLEEHVTCDETDLIKNAKVIQLPVHHQ